MDAMIDRGEVYFGLNGDGMPNTIRYLKDDQGLVPWTWWPHDEVGNNDDSKKEIISLFGEGNLFDTPKPERLMERIIHIGSDPGDLVLDCFAGSGTTAAVSHKMGRRWVTVELNPATAQTFLQPRLQGIVEGTDVTGISVKETESFRDDTLNGEIKPADAKVLVRSLSRLVKAGLLGGESQAETEALVKELRERLSLATTPATVRSGGTFTVARIGPSMYEVDDEDGTVYLSPAATNGPWSTAIAGQLRFSLTPDDPVFCGARGRQRLAVIDGVADENVVRTVTEHLGDRERALIVAKSVLAGAEQLLRDLSPGSRLKKAPDDIFPKVTVR